jgi:hypothetical protein
MNDHSNGGHDQMLRVVKGIWIEEGGLQGPRKPMELEIAAEGTMYDPMVGPMMPVTCEQWGGDAPILTNKCWQFWPDESELTRLGIVPTQMIKR